MADKRPPEEKPSPAYILGLDVGMLSDPSALVVLSTIDEEPPRHYDCVYLKRWPLMIGYEQVISDVNAMFNSNALNARHDRYVVMDSGGVGRPVMEMLERKMDIRGIDMIGVSITAGFDVTVVSPMEFRVPKKDLIGAVQSALGGRRLRIAKGLKEAPQLQHELRQMTMKMTKAGNQQYEALSEKDHDDMAIALALALWFGDNQCPSVSTDRAWRQEAVMPPAPVPEWGPTMFDV